MSAEPQASLLSMIPAWTLSRVGRKRVVETSFATGPGFCAGRVERHRPPISFEQGVAWLERYREHLKGGAIVFEDRGIVWFNWGRYARYQAKAARELPRPGIKLPS